MRVISVVFRLLALTLGLAAMPGWAAGGGTQDLVTLAAQWRQFAAPVIKDCTPDYGAAAMSAKAAPLKDFQARLAALDDRTWSVGQKVDRQLIAAEMNGNWIRIPNT